MYSIPNTLQTALANGTPQRVLIEFTKKPNGTAYNPVVQYSNEDILVDTGVELDETFQSEEDFAVGGTPSAEIRFTMVNDAGQLKTFQFGTFTAWLGARIDSGTPGQNTKTKTFTENGVSRTYQFTPLGTFIAARPNIVSTKTIDVDAYDQMALFEVEMPTDNALNLTWPSTLSNLFVKMCNYVGVNYVSSTFTNSTLSVASRPKSFSNATMRDVMGWIAEAAGSVAKFNRDGKIGMAWFNTVNKTYTESDYSDFVPYRYETKAINKLSVRKDGAEHVTGSGSNAYMILNNPFIGKNTNTAETNIYNKLNAAPTFHPASASLFTDWNIEAGDVVTVTNDNTNYSMPMYNMRLNWAGGTKVDAESTGNEKRESLPALEKKYYGGSSGVRNTINENKEVWIEAEEAIGLLVGRVDDIEQSALYVNRNSITAVVGKFTIDGNNVKLASGSSLQVQKNGVYATVGTVTEIGAVSDRVTVIEGSALWSSASAITAVVGKFTVDGNNLKLVDGASLQVKKDGVYSTVGTVTEINTVAGRIDTIEGSAIWQNRDNINLIAGKFTWNSTKNRMRLDSGASFQVYKDGVWSVVGTTGEINAVSDRVTTIEGSSIWQDRDSISLVAGKLKWVASTNRLRVVEGASLQVSKNGVWSTVGTTTEINSVGDRVTTIEGSSLWQDKDHIALVAGKLNWVSSTNRLRVIEGASLQVSKSGVWSTVGTTTEINAVSDRVTTIEGSTIWQQRSNITAVVGKFTVSNNGNLHITDGTGLYLDATGGNLALWKDGKIQAGVIVDSINDTTVTIQANRINLSGYTTITAFSAVEGKVTNMTSSTVGVAVLRANAMYATNNFYLYGKRCNRSNITIDGVTYNIVTWTS